MGRLVYFIREALRGFYQAKLMTGVSIIAVAVSLVVLGIAAVTAETVRAACRQSGYRRVCGRDHRPGQRCPRRIDSPCP